VGRARSAKLRIILPSLEPYTTACYAASLRPHAATARNLTSSSSTCSERPRHKSKPPLTADPCVPVPNRPSAVERCGAGTPRGRTC
jgi:hypothetical protein